jgi:hypothetical protein
MNEQAFVMPSQPRLWWPTYRLPKRRTNTTASKADALRARAQGQHTWRTTNRSPERPSRRPGNWRAWRMPVRCCLGRRCMGATRLKMPPAQLYAVALSAQRVAVKCAAASTPSGVISASACMSISHSTSQMLEHQQLGMSLHAIIWREQHLQGSWVLPAAVASGLCGSCAWVATRLIGVERPAILPHRRAVASSSCNVTAAAIAQWRSTVMPMASACR